MSFFTFRQFKLKNIQFITLKFSQWWHEDEEDKDQGQGPRARTKGTVLLGDKRSHYYAAITTRAVYYAKKNDKKMWKRHIAYHVTQSNRQVIFENNEDNERFIYTLNEWKSKIWNKLYGYYLMGNHKHLLLHVLNEETGIIMRRVGVSCNYSERVTRRTVPRVYMVYTSKHSDLRALLLVFKCTHILK
jgi:hypothetical protein